MRLYPRAAIYVGLFVLASGLLTSCEERRVYRVTPQDIPVFAENTQPKIPLRAGFFVDDRFANVMYVGPGAFYFAGTVGPAIMLDVRAAFEQATRRMFNEVVPVAATDTTKDFKARNLDVIVSIGQVLCECDARMTGLGSARLTVTVRAEWFVTYPDGSIVTSTRAVGEGWAKAGRTHENTKDAFVKALDAQFMKAYADIVLTAWWRDFSPTSSQ